MNRMRNTDENKKVGEGLTDKGSFVGSRDTTFNGNELLTDVVGTGASAALVSDSPCAMNSLRGLSLLQVQDTLTKLHQLAPNYRRLMPRRPNGKTVSQEHTFFAVDEFQTDVVVTGVSAALVSDSPCAMNSLRGLSLLQVQDTLTKLHQLAPNYRRLIPQRPNPASPKRTFFQADEFRADVVGTGASAALVSDSPCAMNSLRDLSLLQVQDTLTNIAPTRTELPPADAPTTQKQFFGWN